MISVTSVTALEPKISKSLTSLEKKNLSPTSYVLTKAVGTKLFDGTEIIQDSTVLSDSYKLLKSAQVLSSEEEVPDSSPSDEQVHYWDWTLRQFADYLASNTSNTLLYSIETTAGSLTSVSNGVLGYSVVRDEITGDKFDVYGTRIENVANDGVFRKHSSQWRITILPDENQLVLQNYVEGNPTPISEELIGLSMTPSGPNVISFLGRARPFYGIVSEVRPVVILSLWPNPLPESEFL
ncbi:hypothetical protein DLD82_08330 [Methanospirillum stamsii]|uniref:Uncharacterized protein n=2 Tax=Methanospirillum stamsii TaxID=1277351 RepID=A0A2V2NG51_9EURY|nr:hypothetical protein DLD82_08330 [Methanospirillum stamsii]